MSDYRCRTELVDSGYWFEKRGYAFKGSNWVIREDQAHLPHIKVSWYIAGCSETGVCAVLPGETREQAADRAFGNTARFDRRIYDVTWAD